MGPHGFLRAPDGTITTFDPPGSIYTVPTSINPSGAITGYYQDASQGWHGFLRATDGTLTTFDPPGSATVTYTFSINPAGAIAGEYLDYDADGKSVVHGFLRAPDGTFTIFQQLTVHWLPGISPHYPPFGNSPFLSVITTRSVPFRACKLFAKDQLDYSAIGFSF